ncbi:hypothetical protein D3P09_02415 [Paenibacillus pinisoli]|uniref:Uncharacterized protein n=1 Tax=Paenibacillus pinisoli TaxID=1276110 RepID=A0A3A6PIE2_9BACL|nr:hypothetical protein [Paenibacillus pinisoli]RJX40895.1 hypothetical protein D3P09_02415 [Paenibacillus pinisoli]
MDQDHEAIRQQLLQISRSEMTKRHLQALLDGYRKGELSADDIKQYTNIDPEQLKRMLEEL